MSAHGLRRTLTDVGLMMGEELDGMRAEFDDTCGEQVNDEWRYTFSCDGVEYEMFLRKVEK